MTTDDSSSQDPAVLKASEQIAWIRDAFSYRKIETGVVHDGGGLGYMYASNQLLVRDEYLERVKQILGQPAGGQQTERVLPGVVLLHLVEAAAAEGATGEGSGKGAAVASGKRPEVVEALEVLDRILGEGAATPNHVFTVAGPSGPVVSPCPATEPQEVYDGIEPWPGVCSRNSGAGVLVYVADTGLLQDVTAPWLGGVSRALDTHGNDQAWDPLGSNLEIPPYTGHGTFVAGVVRCMAPRADVIVSNVFCTAGSALESDVARELGGALRLGVDVFNLSISAPTRHYLASLGFEKWLALAGTYKGVVSVVAAGNSGVRLPSWPAAFPQVVSVGALTADGRDRAAFSNHGGWVDVYAPGRSHVNAFATGRYTCYEEPYKYQVRNFYGMARWSGTSFSTPLVTGLIAARMWRTGENGQEAAAALLALARSQAIPGVGAVLLPCCGGEHSCRDTRGGGERCCDNAEVSCPAR